MTTRPKELEVASQLSFADDRWHFTVQAWITTERGADAMIDMLNLVKPLLLENAAISTSQRAEK